MPAVVAEPLPRCTSPGLGGVAGLKNPAPAGHQEAGSGGLSDMAKPIFKKVDPRRSDPSGEDPPHFTAPRIDIQILRRAAGVGPGLAGRPEAVTLDQPLPVEGPIRGRS